MSFERDFATLKSFFINQLNRIFFSDQSFNFHLFLIFVLIRGVQPAAHEPEFFCVTQTLSRIFRRFDHFSYQFFALQPRLWGELSCSPETNFGLGAPGFHCERCNHRFEGGLCRLGLTWKLLDGDGVSSGRAWFSWFQNHQQENRWFVVFGTRHQNLKQNYSKVDLGWRNTASKSTFRFKSLPSIQIDKYWNDKT